MNITENVKYVGVNDHEIDLFEGQYIVPNGMAYNSYVIMDNKIAVMDTVDAKFGEQWLENVAKALGERLPDYLVISHMEPDHSSNILAFAEKYPNAQIVGNAKTFAMIQKYFGTDFSDRRVTVKDGETLELGEHSLTFVFAPMVHWPEVMLSYDAKDKILFSADAFGKFGALDIDEDWACEARRYYFGIVGKYGVQVQAVLKKAAALDIEIICPLHGPVLSENLEYYIGLYDTWSAYKAECEGVFIAYTSVYGNTRKAALALKDKLTELGCPKVAISDLAREDMAEAVEDAFKYGKLVLATTTYNGDVFPFMREFINDLTERGYQNRTIGIIENGSWAATAARAIRKKFEASKNIMFTQNTVTINAAMNADNEAQIEALAKELCE